MLRLYNTATRIVEDFHPITKTGVHLYACGPTVYDYAHIGNFRTYIMTDILVRALRYLDYTVTYVTNITDVGHLTSDADSGEDKMEKGARREGKTAWDIARLYTEAFLEDSRKLHLVEPNYRPKATDHIPEQIAMIRTLLDKGHAYLLSDGVYFDTSTFPGYGSLTVQDAQELLAGARVEENPNKKHPQDFALWKLSPPGVHRHMEWDSPWGRGFPGWHIECSAMSRKYLGDVIDIHTGGVDLIPIHHTNEIAQSEAATDVHPFVRYWVHGQFILVDGVKMSKSKNNFYTLTDIEHRGFDPLAFRYLCFTASYRAFLNFTWDSLTSAQNALNELRSVYVSAKRHAASGERSQLSEEKMDKITRFQKSFYAALTNDLNMPKVLSVVWETAKSNIPPQDKVDLLDQYDRILGFSLSEISVPEDDWKSYTDRESGITVTARQEPPTEIMQLLVERIRQKRLGNFSAADAIRDTLLKKHSIEVEDTSKGPKIIHKRN